MVLVLFMVLLMEEYIKLDNIYYSRHNQQELAQQNKISKDLDMYVKFSIVMAQPPFF